METVWHLPFPLFFHFIICPSLHFISALLTKDGFWAPTIHAVYSRTTLFVSGLGTWRYYFPFVMLLLWRSVELWLSRAQAASFRVRRNAILTALLFWDALTCQYVFFVEFSEVSLGHLDRCRWRRHLPPHTTSYPIGKKSSSALLCRTQGYITQHFQNTVLEYVVRNVVLVLPLFCSFYLFLCLCLLPWVRRFLDLIKKNMI